jgi:putative FmdB family regulatory protein
MGSMRLCFPSWVLDPPLNIADPMPLYEYNCLDCERDFELLVRSGEEPHCPECEGTRLAKLLSAPAAHIGGSELPLSQALPAGGCGRPQCGMGGCAGL